MSNRVQGAIAMPEQPQTKTPTRRDFKPNEDIYARSRRAEIAGLDPNYHYQLCNATPTLDGQVSEVQRKLDGEEYGFDGIDLDGNPGEGVHMTLKWEPVSKQAVQGGRLRDDDGSGIDSMYRTGGQVLMRIPKAAMEKRQQIENANQAAIERMLTGQTERVGKSIKVSSGTGGEEEDPHEIAMRAMQKR